MFREGEIERFQTLVRKMKGVRRIEVDYEEVLKDKENLRPVYKFLGLEPPPAGADKTVKMHPTDIPWCSRGVRPAPSRRWRQLHRLLRPPHAIDAPSSAAMASTRRHAHRRSKSSLRRRQTTPRRYDYIGRKDPVTGEITCPWRKGRGKVQSGGSSGVQMAG